MATVFKAIFTSIILSLFYPDGSWLNELTSMDHMVDNNKINLSQVGADPQVLEDNNVYPLTPTLRTDNGIEIPLATFDTVPTHVPNVEELETAYDKCKSVSQQHVNALRTKASVSAAYNIAPASHTATTPVLKTTGADRGDGKKRLTYADVLKLRTSFNKGNLPMTGRVLVLCPEHEEDLLLEDVNRYNRMMERGELAGFKVYTFTENALYDPATGQKQPKGAATGNESSFAFVKTEVMRAMGTIEGEPERHFSMWRGWILGFQMRFVAMPFRNYGIGAIYSDSVAEAQG